MLKKILSISLVRQLLGAAGGALVALSLFTVYREAKPMVMAYVLPVYEEAKDSKEAKEFTEAGMIAVAETDVDIFDPDFELGADSVTQPTFVDPPLAPNRNSVSEESTTDAVTRLRDAAAAARTARLLAPDPVAALVVSDAEEVSLPSIGVSTAPALPSSGIGLGLSLLIALCASVALRKWSRSRSLR